MASDFPYVYPNSRAEAHRRKETQMHEDSFRLNVDCARAIEQAIRDHYDEADKSLTEDCARSVLEKFGFKRVNFVLANSLLEFQKSINCKHLVSEGTYQWGRRVFVSPDGEYNRYYAVDTAAGLLEAFIGQTRDAYQALGLFGPDHCAGDRHEQDFKGKVLVLSPDTLRESCWDPHNQLWYRMLSRDKSKQAISDQDPRLYADMESWRSPRLFRNTCPDDPGAVIPFLGTWNRKIRR